MSPNCIEMKKFIILASQRTGSNYLQWLLNSHRDIFVGGEIFNPNPRHVVENVNIPQSLIDIKDTDPETYLNHYYRHCTERSVGFIGFRMFYGHGENGKGTVWDIIKNIPHLKIIHLQRRNLLKQFLSLKLAEKTSRWLRKETDQPVDYEPISLDPIECKRFFRRQQRKRDHVILFFRNIKIMDCFYEDLAESPDAETGKVLKFLGLKPVALSCDLAKLNTKRLSETIGNYHQLKNQFKETDWETYFED